MLKIKKSWYNFKFFKSKFKNNKLLELLSIILVKFTKIYNILIYYLKSKHIFNIQLLSVKSNLCKSSKFFPYIFID